MNQEQKPHSTVSTAPLVLFLTKHVQVSITVMGYLKARVRRFVKISRGPIGNNKIDYAATFAMQAEQLRG